MDRTYLFLLILAGVAPNAACAEQPEVDYGQIVRGVAATLAKEHFSHRPLDDRFGEEWGAKFIARLDPRKMYFLRSDVKEFRQSYSRLDDLARDGDLSFANQVRDRLKVRLMLGGAVVIVQQSTESLAPLYVALVRPDFISRIDDLVIQPLMIAFLMKVKQVNAAERRLSAI